MKSLLTFLLFTVLAYNYSSKPNPSNDRPSTSHLLEEMDSNGDGKLSPSEAHGPIAKDFNKIDQNKEGYLDIDELAPSPKPPRRHKGNNQQGSDLSSLIDDEVIVVNVNTSYFIKDNLLSDIDQQTKVLNGVPTLCYVIKSRSQASEHQMGSWWTR